MKLRMVLKLLFAFVLVASLAGLAPAQMVQTHPVAHNLLVGPQAEPLTVASAPNYGLFTCQVGLTPFVCYDPYQMRAAYGVDKLISQGLTGKGSTIVIVDAFQSPTLLDDLDAFSAFYGLPLHDAFFTQVAPFGLTPFDPNDDNMVGWSGEISLDVEWAHAIAPEAKIVLVLAKSNDDADILAATQYAVDHRLGDVISQSFGEDERCVDPAIMKAEHEMFVQATRKNMTLIASAGDDGAAQPTCDGSSYSKAASSPASDPLVTAVGGTELHAAGYCLKSLGCDPAANPAPGTYQGEIAWNEFDGGVGSGGGFSVLFNAPQYQLTSIKMGKQRGEPDVAYNAAIYHGVLTVWNGDFWLFGGTSAGSPQWAAIVAIANQKAGRSLGFINSALYRYSISNTQYAAYFHDVTSGDNTFVGFDGAGNMVTVPGYSAGPGWDAVTGLGSPVANSLVPFMVKNVRASDVADVISSTAPTTRGQGGGGHVQNH